MIFIQQFSAIKHSKVYHFADDTNLLKICKSAKQLQKHVNLDLKFLYQWLLANKISLNCSKTELIFFRKPGDPSIEYNFQIKMNGHKIIPSSHIKYLGILLDTYLNGNAHCDLLVKKLKRANGMLCKSRHYVPSDELKSIYYAIFSSHLSYGCQVWGQNIDIHTEKVFKLQNRAMRIISFSDFHADASPIYKELKILKLQDFISLQNSLFVHDFLKKKLPKCFDSYFRTLKEAYPIGTKNAKLGCLFIPFVSTSRYGLRSITRQSILSWNSLCKALNCNLANFSRSIAKNMITSHFFESYH